MIKAIVFDCFGVLASDGWLPFREQHFSDKPELYQQAVALNKSVDAGRLKYDVFVQKVAEMAMVPEAEARVEIENNVPNEQLFEYIRTNILSLYKIGMLSNAGENWLDEIFQPDQVELFDAILLSYEIGHIKPDRIMYETIAERLGVEPTECIFIDDQPKYCDGAREAGMQVIQYIDFAQMSDDLNQLLAR